MRAKAVPMASGKSCLRAHDLVAISHPTEAFAVEILGAFGRFCVLKARRTGFRRPVRKGVAGGLCERRPVAKPAGVRRTALSIIMLDWSVVGERSAPIPRPGREGLSGRCCHPRRSGGRRHSDGTGSAERKRSGGTDFARRRFRRNGGRRSQLGCARGCQKADVRLGHRRRYSSFFGSFDIRSSRSCISFI